VMNMTIREEIDQLSSQVTKLQLQLSLALLELTRRPLHQQRPANDNVNDAGDLVA
jgi:t-SNARE complex subunit (syntaxin)